MHTHSMPEVVDLCAPGDEDVDFGYIESDSISVGLIFNSDGEGVRRWHSRRI